MFNVCIFFDHRFASHLVVSLKKVHTSLVVTIFSMLHAAIRRLNGWDQLRRGGLGQFALLGLRPSWLNPRQELLINVDAIRQKYANLLVLPAFSLPREISYVSIFHGRLHGRGQARGDICIYIIGQWLLSSFCRRLTLPHYFRLARRLFKLMERVEGVNDLSILRIQHPSAISRQG